MVLPSIVEFEVFRDHLGVAADDPAVDDVSKLLDAISFEIRRITRRDFEGDEGGTYSEVYRIRGEREFMLPHVPVSEITSINRVYFDATEDVAYDADAWRLEDADRGIVRLRATPEYVRVIYRTTGDIPATAVQGCLDWGKSRWEERDRTAGLASYQTGDDAESYFASLAGLTPRQVSVALLRIRHAIGGGVA